MLVALVPLFDENLMVGAYSLFTQKKNYLLNPSLLGTGQLDGASTVNGMEVIQSMGIETLSGEKQVFIPVGNISIFSDLGEQCDVPHEKQVLLLDNTITPEKMYVDRLMDLKEQGYGLAIRKLAVSDFEPYREILRLMDCILLDCKKVNVSKAKVYFDKVYPNVKLCVVNIDTMEIFDELKAEGGYQLFEGSFYRTHLSHDAKEVTPLKVNYIQLLNMVNGAEFELTKAADVIGQDMALTISLLQIVNKHTRNSQITSIRHAAAMLGEKELRKWLNTALTNALYTDKPGEITRISLLRARFAENLAPIFEMAVQSSELFLMGLFSVLDAVLERPMAEALDMVKVAPDIYNVLVNGEGKFAPIYDFMMQYESANWQEVSRLMIVNNIDMNQVYEAYLNALQWYSNIITE